MKLVSSIQLSRRNCRSQVSRTSSAPLALVFGTLFSAAAFGQAIDPEQYIAKVGAQSVKLGDDGRTKFFSHTVRASPIRIASLEADVGKLPKHAEVFRVCDFIRGSVKASLIANRHIVVDVAATNYGYKGSTIACVLKYMSEDKVGTQIAFFKKGSDGMYTVYITD